MPKLDWKKNLKSFIQKNKKTRNAQEIEKETDEKFLEHMENFANARQSLDSSYKTIPKFFDKKMLINERNNLQNLIQKEARSRFLHHKTAEILDKEDLEKLWEEIKANISPPDDGNERINYDSFLKIAKSLPPKCRHFFSASTFLKFDRDEYGRIDCVSFFHSIVRKVSLFQTRIQISLYDSRGNGYLLEHDLVNFISEIMPTFPNVSELKGEDKEKYLMITSSKFFFFLDPKKTGKVFIKDILTSPILAELYDLRSEKSDEEFLNNWFSRQNATRIIKLFEKLDENKDGLLNHKELSSFQWGLTDLFIRRVLETFSNLKTFFQLDFKNFVQFILFIENKKTKQSIQFLFKNVDIFQQGYIDTFIINTFFKEIVKKLLTKDNEADKNFKIEDVKDEIFDMANPKNPMFISLYDLYECGQGDVILSILIDAKAFFDYDQRELGNTLNVEEDSHFEFVPGLNDKEEEEDMAEAEVVRPKSFGKYAEV